MNNETYTDTVDKALTRRALESWHEFDTYVSRHGTVRAAANLRRYLQAFGVHGVEMPLLQTINRIVNDIGQEPDRVRKGRLQQTLRSLEQYADALPDEAKYSLEQYLQN